MEKTLVWPDYRNCTANLPNSILKAFGAQTVGETLPLLDPYLEKAYKNIVLVLLDGMGIRILERHLRKNGAFRSRLKGIYKSVFLSTTVAATTSLLSGLQPCEHSWLGWDCYYPQIDRNVTVFLNALQGTEEPAADFHVARTFTPYTGVTDRVNRTGAQGLMAAPFLDPALDTIGKLCGRVRDLCTMPGRKYIYAYWNEPDGLLHRHGCGSEEVHLAMRNLEETVAALAAETEDTLVIVTADHGHIDTEAAVLTDYPELWDCLERAPSLEPRALNLFVKEGRERFFAGAFNDRFGDRFLLLPMEEVLERKLFGTGTHHPCFRGMLGNWLAIATGNLSIFNDSEVWVSMHGSVTEDEMLIPLIVFD